MRFSFFMFVYIVSINIAFGRNITVFQVDSNFKTKTCKNKERTFKELDIPNSLVCGSICASMENCKSFFFFPTSFRCDGCTLMYDIKSKLARAGEKTLYYTPGDVNHTSMYRSPGCLTSSCGNTECSFDKKIYIVGNHLDYCLERCELGVKRVDNFAVEGESCFCNWVYSGSSTLTRSDCNFICTGNANQFCGGNGSVSLYVHIDLYGK